MYVSRETEREGARSRFGTDANALTVLVQVRVVYPHGGPYMKRELEYPNTATLFAELVELHERGAGKVGSLPW